MSGENTAEFTAPLLREAEGWQDYRLLDSGHGRKRTGGALPVYPARSSGALAPALDAAEWQQADGEFISVLPGVTG